MSIIRRLVPIIELRKIRIKNFKSLEDFEIDIKDINFLFGANGSGKSTFIKSMMFLFENLKSLANKDTGLENTIYKVNDKIDLGDYAEIVTNNEIHRKIEFELCYYTKYELPKKSVFNEYRDLRDYFEIKNLFRNLKNEEVEKIENEFTLKVIFDKDGIYFIEIKSGENLLSFNYKSNSSSDNNENERLRFSEFKFIINSCKYLESVNNDTGKWKWSSERFFRKKSFYDITLIMVCLNDLINEERSEEMKFKREYIAHDNISYNEKEKLNQYYETLKFAFIINDLIPELIKKHFNIEYIPQVRQIPRIKYFVSNNIIEGLDNYEKYLDIFYSQKNIFGIVDKILESKKETNIQNSARLFRKIKKNLKSYKKELIDIYEKEMEIGAEGINERYNIKNKSYFLINNYLQILGFEKYVILQKTDDIFKIFFLDKNGVITNFANECSGLIQIFPILLSLTTSTDNKKFIEQPELHLHPKIQASLAKVFLYYAGQLFIETHSEHLIRKTQVIISKENKAKVMDSSIFAKNEFREFPTEKINVNYYFVNKQLVEKTQVNFLYKDRESGFTKNEIRKIQENGFFEKKWPDGFFSTGYDLTKELITGEEI